MKVMPIGRDNFKDIIEEGCYYVDKTKIIEDFSMQKKKKATKTYLKDYI